MEWFYQAIEQYDYITIRNISLKIISVCLMFLLVHKPDHYIIYAGINVVGTVGSNILNFIRIRKYVDIRFIDGVNIKKHLRPILVFFLFTVSATIYTSLDSVMLGFLANDKEVGLYAASIKMRNILYHLVTAIGTVLLPRASYLIQNKEMGKYRQIIGSSLQFIALMSVPLTIYSILQAKGIILFLAGDDYSLAVTSMMIVTPTVFLAGISNITGIQVLIPLGFEKYTVASTFGGAITDLVLNSIFIPMYGAAGAAFGTLIAEVVVLILQLYFLKKNGLMMHIYMEWRNLLKILFASVLPGVFLLISNNLITYSSSFIQLLITGSVYFGVYALVLTITKERIFLGYIINSIKRICSK